MKMAVANILWDDNKGPLENILYLVEIGSLFLPGSKLMLYIAVALGYGPSEFGRKLDSIFGLNSVEDLIHMDFEEGTKMIVEELQSLANKMKYASSRTIAKKAGLITLLTGVSRKKAISISKRLGFFGVIKSFLSSSANVAKGLGKGAVGAVVINELHKKNDGEVSDIPFMQKDVGNKKGGSSLEESIEKAFLL